jgi:GNAT superfamily N-acetyltransferase
MSYEMVPYSPALAGQIAELQTHLWSSDPARNAAYLKWKHLDNPFFPEPLIQLGMHAGRAVAMRSAFGTLWEVGDSSSQHLLPYVDDFVVAPEHRNSGVGRQVMQAAVAEACRRAFPYAINLSAGPVTFINSLATGWRRIGSFGSVRHSTARHSQLQRIAAVVRRTPYLNRIRDVLRAAFLRAMPSKQTFDKLERQLPSAGPIAVASDPRPHAMAGLISRLPWDGRMRHVRDERYFSWRFRNPLHEYRFLYWDDDHGLQGYLVLQMTLFPQPNPTLLGIADWEAANEKVRAGLLDAALRTGGLTQMRTWTATISDTTRALLHDRGFEPPAVTGLTARTEGLLVRPLGAVAVDQPWLLGGHDLRKMENWDLRLLYSMSA